MSDISDKSKGILKKYKEAKKRYLLDDLLWILIIDETFLKQLYNHSI